MNACLERLTLCWGELVVQMECEYGLLEIIKSQSLLSMEQYEELLYSAKMKQNQTLLLLLYKLEERELKCFTTALKETGQGHLAALLEYDEGIKCLFPFLCKSCRYIWTVQYVV